MRFLLVAVTLVALTNAIPIGTQFNATSTDSGLGLDLSIFQGDVSLSSFQCLRNNGFSFAIFQGQTQSGDVNPHAISDYNNAKAAGFNGVDFYIFPNTNQDPAAQARNTVNYLKNGGVINGNMIWVDVEGSWNSDVNGNVAFIRSMVDTIQSMGVGVGIYSSKSQWVPITGDDHSFANLPIWYAHYDGVEHMSDFTSFGGWTRPAMKQYQGTTSICGTSIDYDTWN